MRNTGRFNVAQGAVITAQSIGAALSTTLAGLVVVKAGYSAAFLVLGASLRSASRYAGWRCPRRARVPTQRRNRCRQHGRLPVSLPNDFRNPETDLTMPPHETFLAWSIILPATAGVIIRPFRLPEAIWAMAGAIALVLLGVLPLGDALNGMRKGIDVYLFLIGMMLIAELARREGLFDYLAALAVEHARGSPQRLFLLVYAVGTSWSPCCLSNDATAIVLTPAVYAATRAAGAAPLPYLFVCAFIANAASFVLPISNPANLVVFGARMPHLTEWLREFTLPSIASIVVTYIVLRLSQHRALKEDRIESRVPEHPRLSHGGRLTAFGIGAIAVILIGASALDVQLGLADLHLRRGYGGRRARSQPPVAMAGDRRRFLERVAAGGRPVRDGGSTDPDWRDRAAQRAAASGRGAVRAARSLGCRHRNRHCR